MYIGGANRSVPGYVNLDLYAVPGVDVLADAHQLPFADNTFTRVECDAVLEHVVDPERVMREIERVLAPGGHAHVVAPFCHPFHEYPRDYRRFTIDGLLLMRGGLTPVASGWRTGPAATWLIVTLEFIKLWIDTRWWRKSTHFVFGWLLFPIRYVDRWLLRVGKARRIGNHAYVWFTKAYKCDI